jgi:type I restriction enzyme R subunit
MSELLDALIKQRREDAIAYEEYLLQVVELTKAVKNPAGGVSYPATLNTPARRALYDNLGKDATLALAVDAAVRDHRQDDWRNNAFKVKKVKNAINAALNGDVERTDVMLELVKNQHEY